MVESKSRGDVAESSLLYLTAAEVYQKRDMCLLKYSNVVREMYVA